MGQVGAGKSSLIAAIIGDMHKVEGQVTIKVGAQCFHLATHSEDWQEKCECVRVPVVNNNDQHRVDWQETNCEGLCVLFWQQ